MKWVTREHPHTDRIAWPWLIRTFTDLGAEIVCVPRDQAVDYAAREGATSFDTPGARYTHRDGLEAIARGFMHLGVGDQEQLALELPVYDSLYAWARLQAASEADTSPTGSRP